ncbi:hypothetical protein [Mycobacterium sp. TY815]|uniref:hypothetical protein n=1 Tax=Mycobacterium sp. TY815 TaxID=3050581 RepID=UPI0027408A1A|nr:hypothetical protein [Mycobacterium sp. TY815]MDP7707402.1 hypothetical protein [Mycobacterium sp. TY815]
MYDFPGMPSSEPTLFPVVGATSCLHSPSAQALAMHADVDGPDRRREGRPLSCAEQWWQYTRRCAAALRAGHPPPPVKVFGPVLAPREQAWLSADVGYSRYCSTSVSSASPPWIVAGRPAVMFGALAFQGIMNHRRRAAEQRQAVPQWRWHQTTAAIVTTDRLLCATRHHGIVSFWFADCTEFHPDLHRWTLTLNFDSTAPVRISGVAAPVLSLLSAYGMFGHDWVDDTRLAALLS